MDREALFADYDSHHQSRGNRLTHFVGIPFIIFGTVGLLGRLKLGTIGEAFTFDAGLLLIVLVTPLYLWLRVGLGSLFILTTLGLWWLASHTALAPLLVVFVAGWVLQFVGHAVYEKRQPAFLKNLIHVFVGPLWIFGEILGLRPNAERPH